jgi:hypothetical protein
MEMNIVTRNTSVFGAAVRGGVQMIPSRSAPIRR